MQKETRLTKLGAVPHSTSNLWSGSNTLIWSKNDGVRYDPRLHNDFQWYQFDDIRIWNQLDFELQQNDYIWRAFLIFEFYSMDYQDILVKRGILGRKITTKTQLNRTSPKCLEWN